jgi:DNA polymerase I-like protein with 3'-5' exonuclease and polymerase domains
MLAVDTETTGLYFQHGATTFSIGAYDGDKFRHQSRSVCVHSRVRDCGFSSDVTTFIRNAGMVVCHNLAFDVRALVEAGVWDAEEPRYPEFWRNKIDTTELAHLYSSVDELGLDSLTRKYLKRGYDEDDALITCVNRCRALVRKLKLDWNIADEHSDHPNVIATTKNHNRLDFWLPAAVLKHVPSHRRPDLPDSILRDVLVRYLRADCVNTYELAEYYLSTLTERHGDDLERMLSINRDISHVLYKMQQDGIYVNQAELSAAIESCEYWIGILSQKAREQSGLEKITNDTLRALLFQDWGLEPVELTKKSKQPATSASALLKLRDQVENDPEKFNFLGVELSHRKYLKKLQYLTTYRLTQKNCFLHPSFNKVGTSTTRFSSNNPNIQQVGKAGNPYEEDAPDIAKWLEYSPSLRSCFGPRPGHWWLDCDYSQLQLRIFAFITNEQEMIDAFDRGWDAHDYVARRIFDIRDSSTPTSAQRRIAKNVNFGFIFGASPKRIEKTAGIPGLWDTVLQLFPNAHAFIEETKQTIKAKGYVETIGGYPLELRDQWNQWTCQYEKAAHAGVNYVVQGAEGMIAKRAMLLCDDYLVSEFPEGRIVLQCHDELIFEMPERFPKKHCWALCELMEQAAAEYGIKAPVDPELCMSRWDKSVSIRRA